MCACWGLSKNCFRWVNDVFLWRDPYYPINIKTKNPVLQCLGRIQIIVIMIKNSDNSWNDRLIIYCGFIFVYLQANFREILHLWLRISQHPIFTHPSQPDPTTAVCLFWGSSFSDVLIHQSLGSLGKIASRPFESPGWEFGWEFVLFGW